VARVGDRVVPLLVAAIVLAAIAWRTLTGSPPPPVPAAD